MSQKKIKLDSDLYQRAQKMAEKAGYASVDEFVNHLLEKELSSNEKSDDVTKEVEKQLRGLGYIT